MDRRISRAKWAEDHCFELIVDSPYELAKVYKTFDDEDDEDDENRPDLTDTTDANVKNIKYKRDRISFTLSGFEDDEAESVVIKMKNFRTPFSARRLADIRVVSYRDRNCYWRPETIDVRGIDIDPSELLEADVTLGSTSLDLADTRPETAL